MKFTKIALSLALGFASFLSANLFAKTQVTVTSDIESSIKEIKAASNQWFHYQIKMEPDNGMPCCYQKAGKTGCSLEGDNYGWGSYGSNSDESEQLSIYFKKTNEGLEKLTLAGAECSVDTSGASIIDLLDVSNEQSIEFLTSQLDLKQKKRNGERIIAGIAYHSGAEAQKFIESLLAHSQHKENAIFWLGAARNEAGYKRLNKLLNDKNEDRKSKSRAIFALSENSSSKAIPRILEIAKESPDFELKGEALFWLAQKKVEEAYPVIESLLEEAGSRRVIEKAVFALSQYRNKKSWNKLVDLAKRHQSLIVREKSIFWLSQTDEVEGVNPLPVLMTLTKKDEPKRIREQAVFAISQLEGEDSVDGLVSLIKNSKDKFVKKKAIFWLGQSENPKAIELIDDLFALNK